jgi:hypothetical protein
MRIRHESQSHRAWLGVQGKRLVSAGIGSISEAAIRRIAETSTGSRPGKDQTPKQLLRRCRDRVASGELKAAIVGGFICIDLNN